MKNWNKISYNDLFKNVVSFSALWSLTNTPILFRINSRASWYRVIKKFRYDKITSETCISKKILNTRVSGFFPGYRLVTFNITFKMTLLVFFFKWQLQYFMAELERVQNFTYKCYFDHDFSRWPSRSDKIQLNFSLF